MLDHMIVTIYGYRVSIHRLIQLIDLFLAVSAGGGLQTGEFIVLGSHIWSSSWGLSSGGYWVSGYTGLTLPWG